MADKPVTREEMYLAYLTGDYAGELPKPITRKEKYLYELCLKGMGGEVSPEEIKSAVTSWLNEHPEATTTVTDGSITDKKLETAFLNMIGYPIFDTFPSESIINILGDGAIFCTRGFYKKNDGGDCCYIIHKRHWLNCIVINSTYYVSPLGMSQNIISMNKYGILPNRTGVENTEALSKLKNNFGAVIQFADGHYYFDSPIDFSDSQCSIIGSHSLYSNDSNSSSGTWLHFENLSDGDSAIKIRAATIENVCVIGSKDQYSLKINRAKLIDDAENIVTETYTAKCCGIELISGSKIKETIVRNFYNAITGSAGNQLISNVVVSNCHTGIICKNDNKASNINISNAMIGIESRGSLNSFVSIRGDSIGKHLIVVTTSNTTIVDADGDFCVEALISIGDANDKWQNVSGLYICGLHGRCNAKHAYHRDSTPPSIDEITDDNLYEYPIIAVNKNSNLIGANIQLNSSTHKFILDDNQQYLTPKFLLCCGSGTNVTNVKISVGNNKDDSDNANNEIRIDKNYCEKRIKSLSKNKNSLLVSVENYADKVIIRKSGAIYNYSKVSTETI